MTRYAAAPFCLSSSVSLLSGATGTPDMAQMQSPFRQPMLLDAIGFLLRPISASLGVGVNVGGIIRCKLAIGRMKLTEDFVPVWNFGRAYQSGLEQLFAVSGGVTAGKVASYSNYLWKLPTPLFMPPGSPLVPTFSRVSTYDSQITDFAASDAIQVTVTYHGRYLATPHKPKRIKVPYVSAWVQATNQNAAPTEFFNPETTLRNPFETNLHVQRFIFRLQNVASGISDEMPKNAGRVNTMMIKDTLGYDVIPVELQDNMAGSFYKRAWDFNQVLAPQEHYQVKLLGVSNLSALGKETPMVSMVGWREEKLSW